jgi:hypothetical protein
MDSLSASVKAKPSKALRESSSGRGSIMNIRFISVLLLVSTSQSSIATILDKSSPPMSVTAIESTVGGLEEGASGSDSVSSIRRWRPWASIGSPFLLNLGLKCNISEYLFVEASFPIVLSLTPREGFFSASFGMSLREHTSGGGSNFIFEPCVTVGVSEPFFGDKGVYSGLSVNGIMETRSGFCCFLRLGGSYFFYGRGGLSADIGFGWSF